MFHPFKKFLATLALSAFALAASPAHAQLGDMLKKAKDKAATAKPAAPTTAQAGTGEKINLPSLDHSNVKLERRYAVSCMANKENCERDLDLEWFHKMNAFCGLSIPVSWDDTWGQHIMDSNMHVDSALDMPYQDVARTCSSNSGPTFRTQLAQVKKFVLSEGGVKPKGTDNNFGYVLIFDKGTSTLAIEFAPGPGVVYDLDQDKIVFTFIEKNIPAS